jgi:hypothetical protein
MVGDATKQTVGANHIIKAMKELHVLEKNPDALSEPMNTDFAELHSSRMKCIHNKYACVTGDDPDDAL